MISLVARLAARMFMMAEAMDTTSISSVTTTSPIMALSYSAVALASLVYRNSVASVMDASATVVSDRATTSQTESLMMADVATSVVQAVLSSAVALVDTV